MFAWHFVGPTLRDGSAIPDDGVPLIYTKPLKICESGLHFSLDPFDALQYAPGEVLCKVKVEREATAQRQVDKGVCAKRTIVIRHNVRELLYDFACAEAWAVIKTHNPPSIIKAYLLGTPEERDAERAAASAAARGAARDAAWDAAWAAAWAAAWDVAQGAARGAARGAAWGAARERQRATFNQMVFNLFNME